MKILLLLFLLPSCALHSYNPCMEKFPHNRLDQEVCKEVRQRDIDNDMRGIGLKVNQFNKGITF